MDLNLKEASKKISKDFKPTYADAKRVDKSFIEKAIDNALLVTSTLSWVMKLLIVYSLTVVITGIGVHLYYLISFAGYWTFGIILIGFVIYNYKEIRKRISKLFIKK